MSGLQGGLAFLITTLFDLYLFLLIIRVMLAFAGANYYDPITQFVVRCTDFIIKPLRRVIPNYRGIEISTVLLIFVLDFLKYALLAVLSIGMISTLGLLIIAAADTLKLFLQTYFYAIILQAILSWVQPSSPVNSLLYRVTAPIMRPIQRLVPTVGGVDISPIPAMILLQLTIIMVVNPLMAVGLGVSLG
jgi:YggT family protein